MHMILAIFALVCFVGLSLLAFGVWLAVSIVRFLFRLIFGGKAKPVLEVSGSTIHCPRQRCHAPNPVGAKYCRRCGANLVAGQVPRPIVRSWDGRPAGRCRAVA